MDFVAAITAFIRAAERGGFSSAARDLRVSQPHVTRAVQQLETRLGTRLFNRSTRRLTLTDEGADYLLRAKAIIAAIEDADQSVGARAGTLSGQLRVFAPVSLGRMWVVPRLAEFMARHPALDVALILDDRPRDLIEERIDVALRVGPLGDTSDRARHLGDVARVVAAAPAYWQQRGRPERPEDLCQHEAIIFDGPILVDHIAFKRGTETAQIPIKGRLHSNSSEAMQEALRLGMGFTLAPWWLVSADIVCATIERVLADWEAVPSLPIHAVYPASRVPSEKVRRFIDWFVYALHADGLYAPG